MRENLISTPQLRADGRRYLPNDWFSGSIPANVELSDSVYLDSSYGFAEVFSRQAPGLSIGMGSGLYDNPGFLTGPQGRIRIGNFTILNASKLICNLHIDIGSHCMLAWGSIVTDTWLDSAQSSPQARRILLEQAAVSPDRFLIGCTTSRPVIIEDNCWIGFGAVVLPGVRIGRGAVVASKSIVSLDVPAYAVVAGSPARVVRMLEPDDTEEARQHAFREYLRQ